MAAQITGTDIEEAINKAITDAELIERASEAKTAEEAQDIKDEYKVILQNVQEKLGELNADGLEDLDNAEDGSDPLEGALTFDQVYKLHVELRSLAVYLDRIAVNLENKADKDQEVADIENDQADDELDEAYDAQEKADLSSQKALDAREEAEIVGKLSNSPPRQKRGARAAPASPRKRVAAAAPVAEKVVDKNESKLIGAFPYIGTAYNDLAVKPEVFWDVTDPYAVNKKNKGTPADLKALKYKIFTAPYKKNPRKAQIANLKVINDIAEGLSIADEAKGMYGKNVTLAFTLESGDNFTVTEEDTDFARKVFAQRIQLGENLARNSGAKDPSAPSAGRKLQGAYLTDAAVQWIAREEFYSEYMPADTEGDLKKFLAKELGTPFGKTYLASGKVTRNNYNRLFHLALEKEKYDERTNALSTTLLDPVKTAGKKPSAQFKSTPAIKALNNADSEIKYVNNKRVNAGPDEITVGDAIKSRNPAYKTDTVVHNYVSTLGFATSHTAETAPAAAAFIKDANSEGDSFKKETEAIEKYFKLRKPLYEKAVDSRNAVINKTKPKTQKTAPKTRKRAVKK